MKVQGRPCSVSRISGGWFVVFFFYLIGDQNDYFRGEHTENANLTSRKTSTFNWSRQLNYRFLSVWNVSRQISHHFRYTRGNITFWPIWDYKYRPILSSAPNFPPFKIFQISPVGESSGCISCSELILEASWCHRTPGLFSGGLFCGFGGFRPLWIPNGYFRAKKHQIFESHAKSRRFTQSRATFSIGFDNFGQFAQVSRFWSRKSAIYGNVSPAKNRQIANSSTKFPDVFNPWNQPCQTLIPHCCFVEFVIMRAHDAHSVVLVLQRCCETCESASLTPTVQAPLDLFQNTPHHSDHHPSALDLLVILALVAVRRYNLVTICIIM